MISLQEIQRREAYYRSQIDDAIDKKDLDRMLNVYRQASIDLRRNEVTPMIEGHLAKVRKEMKVLGYGFDDLEYFVDNGNLPSLADSGRTWDRISAQRKADPSISKKEKKIHQLGSIYYS